MNVRDGREADVSAWQKIFMLADILLDFVGQGSIGAHAKGAAGPGGLSPDNAGLWVVQAPQCCGAEETTKMTAQNKPLTVAQLLILSTAAQRPDRMILPLPEAVRVRGASQQRLLGSLLKLGLAEEVSVVAGQLSWRHDAECQHYALRLAAEGMAASGVIAEPEQPEAAQADQEQTASKPPVAETIIASSELLLVKDEPAATSNPAPGGKLGQVLTAIGTPAGATLDDLVTLTGWLPHTTRAAITRLKQRGYPVHLVKAADRKAYQLLQKQAA